MSRSDIYFYPAAKKAIHSYAEAVFSPIRRGECVTAIWVSMAGRRLWNKFIIENIKLFDTELPNFQKYLLTYIEPLDLTEESLAGYLRLLGKSLWESCQKHSSAKLILSSWDFKIFEDESVSYAKLLDSLKTLIKKATNSNLEVVFFLGELDELKFANKIFYNNLTSLWELLEPKLHYVFLTTQEDPSSHEAIDRYGELNALTLQNIVYVSLRSGSDIDYLLGYFSDKQGYRLSSEQKDTIKSLCGGHPYLLKAATRIVINNNLKSADQIEQILLIHYDIITAARRIYGLRTEREKKIIQEVALGKTPADSPDLERLEKLGIVVRDTNQKYKLFGRLLSHVALKKDPTSHQQPKHRNGLNLSLTGEIVTSDGTLIDERFTPQEYNLIKFFLAERGKLKSRDEVGKVLWGEESSEKYSDWAIDQLVSKIRKKLKEIGTETQISTIKGRGFKLT